MTWARFLCSVSAAQSPETLHWQSEAAAAKEEADQLRIELAKAKLGSGIRDKDVGKLKVSVYQCLACALTSFHAVVTGGKFKMYVYPDG